MENNEQTLAKKQHKFADWMFRVGVKHAYPWLMNIGLLSGANITQMIEKGTVLDMHETPYTLQCDPMLILACLERKEDDNMGTHTSAVGRMMYAYKCRRIKECIALLGQHDIHSTCVARITHQEINYEINPNFFVCGTYQDFISECNAPESKLLPFRSMLNNGGDLSEIGETLKEILGSMQKTENKSPFALSNLWQSRKNTRFQKSVETGNQKLFTQMLPHVNPNKIQIPVKTVYSKGDRIELTCNTDAYLAYLLAICIQEKANNVSQSDELSDLMESISSQSPLDIHADEPKVNAMFLESKELDDWEERISKMREDLHSCQDKGSSSSDVAAVISVKSPGERKPDTEELTQEDLQSFSDNYPIDIRLQGLFPSVNKQAPLILRIWAEFLQRKRG